MREFISGYPECAGLTIFELRDGHFGTVAVTSAPTVFVYCGGP
jgi:hypothetical protein